MEKIKRDVKRLIKNYLLCNQTDLVNMLFTKDIVNKNNIENLITNYTKEIKILNTTIKDLKGIEREQKIKEYEEMRNKLKEEHNKEQKIHQWWLVNGKFADILDDEKEPILKSNNCFWWGRCETNENIEDDELIIDLAYELYKDDDF